MAMGLAAGVARSSEPLDFAFQVMQIALQIPEGIAHQVAPHRPRLIL